MAESEYTPSLTLNPTQAVAQEATAVKGKDPSSSRRAGRRP